MAVRNIRYRRAQAGRRRMGVLRIKIEHWRQVKIRVRWLPKNLEAYEPSEPALAFRRWEEMCRQEDEEAKTMQQQEGAASGEGQSQISREDGAEQGAQDIKQDIREETDVVPPAAAEKAEQQVAEEPPKTPVDLQQATAEGTEELATEEEHGHVDDASQATEEAVEPVGPAERHGHVDDVPLATAALVAQVVPAEQQDQQSNAPQPPVEEMEQHAPDEQQSVSEDKVPVTLEELEHFPLSEAEDSLEDGSQPAAEEVLQHAPLKEQSHSENALQATVEKVTQSARGEQHEDLPQATEEAEERASNESKCDSEIEQQAAKVVEGERQLPVEQQSDLDDVMLATQDEGEERAFGEDQSQVEQAPHAEAQVGRPEEEQSDEGEAPRSIKDGAEGYSPDEGRGVAVEAVESLQRNDVNVEATSPDDNAANMTPKVPDTKNEEPTHATMEVSAQSQESCKPSDGVDESHEARHCAEDQPDLEAEPNWDDSTRMLEGDTLEALVEVFRISEEEVAKRAKVDFVHENMSTFSRSWLQLMTFYVWVFSKYNSLNCGSSSMKLELIEKKTSEDPRFVAAFKGSCVIKYNLKQCEVDTLPVKLEYEFRIQKNTDLPDLEKLSEMSLEAELRFRDQFLLDSRFEPSLPPPHITTLTDFLVRPLSVSAENIESGDDVASRIAITITNHHKIRKLCICDVRFLLAYRNGQKKRRSPFEKSFAWYWVAREPTPYDIEPGQSWTIRLDIYSRREGYENKWFESPFELHFDWYDPSSAKHLEIYFSKHTVKWRAAATSIEEERKPVIDLDKATSNPYEGLLPLRPPSPPPPVQKPEFEVPPDRELFRVRRIFSGAKDPVTGARVFPPDDTESDTEQAETGTSD